MNTLQSIVFYAPLIVILFWGTTIGVSVWRPENKFKLPFLFFLINSFVAILIGSFFHTLKFDLFRALYVTGAFISLAMFPLFHLFILSLTKESKLTPRVYLKHLMLPLCSMSFAFVMLYIIGDKGTRVSFVEDVLSAQLIETPFMKATFIMDKIFRMLFIITAVLYFYLTEKRISAHRHNIDHYFSNKEEAGVDWYKNFRIIFSLTLLAGVIYYALDRSITLDHYSIPSVSRFLLAIFFWVIGYYVSQQKMIYHKIEPVEEVKEVPDDVLVKLAAAMEKKMNEEMLFKESMLTLPMLAKELGTNRTYVSRVFNVHLNTKFNTYVNDKRIAYA